MKSWSIKNIGVQDSLHGAGDVASSYRTMDCIVSSELEQVIRPNWTKVANRNRPKIRPFQWELNSENESVQGRGKKSYKISSWIKSEVGRS
jgi:hypothetical protein